MGRVGITTTSVDTSYLLESHTVLILKYSIPIILKIHYKYHTLQIPYRFTVHYKYRYYSYNYYWY